ncbi:hypothetical protein [Paenibacillus xylanexedens]|uniref:hypothetical protein n=1 Tax=Paenibacillus xylanexedens TaxID=528191 RepID=UPI0011A2242A|nr:hypothetical protein [Paenibacillus xylanexedens]
MDNDSLLSGYRESLKVAWGYNDYDDWPLRISSIMHLFADVFAEEFIEDLNVIWDDQEGPERLANIFGYPGRLFRLIDVVLFGLRRKRMPLEEQRAFIVKMLRAAETLKSGDVFNREGSNVLKRPSLPEAEQRNTGHSSLIHKLQAALFMYTEAVLFRGHDAAKSVHGPYMTEQNTMLVIREFHNLHPQEVWPKELLMTTGKITTCCEYDKSADVKVDCYDHIYHSGRLNQSMLSWHVSVDGVSVHDPVVLEQMVDDIIRRTRQVSGMVDQWDWQQKAEKYAQIFWFRKSPLRAYRGLPTLPPQQVYEQIRSGKPNEGRSRSLTSREVALLIQLGV